MVNLEPLQVTQRAQLVSKLARWIATEQYELPEILEKLGITEEFYEYVAQTSEFGSQLLRERDMWNEPSNVSDRVKNKAGTIMERWLVEAYGRLHDQKESLAAKTELAKLMTRLAGMGVDRTSVNGVEHDRFVVNINLGQDKLTFAKDISTKTIEQIPEPAAIP